MRYLIAFFCPWIAFFTIGKVFQGLLCLLLQITLIGWIPAVIWSFFSVSDYYRKKDNDRVIEAINANRRS